MTDGCQNNLTFNHNVRLEVQFYIRSCFWVLNTMYWNTSHEVAVH